MSIALNITGGIVSVEDGIKAKEEFAPARKARVELHFDVPEGGDHNAHVSGVVDVAKAHLHRILHSTAIPAVVAQVAATTAAKVPAAEEAKPETAAAKKKRLAAEEAAKPQGNDKEALAKAAGLPTKDTVHKGAAQTDEELLDDEPTITAAGKPVVEEDDLNDLLGDSAPVVVTDLELANAVQKKNAERKEADPNWAPAKIRDVISEYSGGKRVNDIPAAKRSEFLKKIEALK